MAKEQKHETLLDKALNIPVRTRRVIEHPLEAELWDLTIAFLNHRITPAQYEQAGNIRRRTGQIFASALIWKALRTGYAKIEKVKL